MSPPSPSRRLAIVGRGRLGTALARGLRGSGHSVAGPLGRSYRPEDLQSPEIVLLCVPDEQIAAAAAVLAERCPDSGARPIVGHCSGATGLSALGAPEALSLHPLMTVTTQGAGPPWTGAVAAVSGSTDRALAAACELARDLGLRPLPIAEEDRAAYHAAASMASNFLVTLEVAAERLAASAGAGRDALLPLVRRTVENWGAAGAGALTGPIARGDDATVARQRAAVLERAPELGNLFDALTAATREIARPAPVRDARTVGA